ncbi:MAG: hypothetical protein IT168_07625 [Bryobacterales bacterium]|nr:hypothetical protein [Bryobacterales bacterium]
MTITIDLQPEVERTLSRLARANGVSVAEYAQQVLSREVSVAGASTSATGQVLIEAFMPFRGLGDDLEIRRNSSPSRPVDF